MARCAAAPNSCDVIMHLVLDDHHNCYETGPLTFTEVVDRVRDGQYGAIHRVLSLTFVGDLGIAADVTREVACAIYVDSARHPIIWNGPAFRFVERELSCLHAEECAWEDAAGRFADRKRDMQRRNRELDA